MVRRTIRPTTLRAACTGLLAVPLLIVAHASSAASDGAALGDSRLGRRLIVQFQCGRCHEIPGVDDARGGSAPTLERIGARRYLAGQLPNEPRTLARWIVDPAALLPGAAMPAMGVNQSQARDMAAYLMTLR